MKTQIISALVILLLTTYSCKKNPEPTDQKKFDINKVEGVTILLDEGMQGVKDWSGVKVTLENSNPVVSTITDSSGHFSLPVDPKYKSFNLVYSKEKYGTYKQYFERRTNDTIYYSFNYTTDTFYSIYDHTLGPNLGQISTAKINSFNVTIVNGTTLRVTCDISSPYPEKEKGIRLLFQKNNKDISFENVDKSNRNDWLVITPVKDGSNTIDECLSCNIRCHKWQSGDTIYVTAYPDSQAPNFYFDRSTNTYVCPNINLNNKAPIVSFIVP